MTIGKVSVCVCGQNKNINGQIEHQGNGLVYLKSEWESGTERLNLIWWMNYGGICLALINLLWCRVSREC